jgi:hypothetical protein
MEESPGKIGIFLEQLAGPVGTLHPTASPVVTVLEHVSVLGI